MKTTTHYYAFFVFMCLLYACQTHIKNANQIGHIRQPNQKITNFLKKLKNRDITTMNPESFWAFIETEYPTLENEIKRDLLNNKKIKCNERISLKYHWFKNKNRAEMENHYGEYETVSFENKFVIEIQRPNQKKQFVALSCLNGMKNIQRSPQISSKTIKNKKLLLSAKQRTQRQKQRLKKQKQIYETIYTIKPGQSLFTYIKDLQVCIELAQKNNIQIQKKNNTIITVIQPGTKIKHNTKNNTYMII